MTTVQMHLKMAQFERQARQDEAAHVTHPLEDYQGERLERLYQQMDQAQRWQWPPMLTWNV